MNRWTSYGSPNAESDWLEVDFGKPKRVARVLLHIYDDHGDVQAPKAYNVEAWMDGKPINVLNPEALNKKPT